VSHRAIWLSDIHLNFIDFMALTRFAETVERERADSVLISGDIAEATNLSKYLTFLARNLSAPAYFVLGNHDFYGGSDTRKRDFSAVVKVDRSNNLRQKVSSQGDYNQNENSEYEPPTERQSAEAVREYL